VDPLAFGCELISSGLVAWGMGIAGRLGDGFHDAWLALIIFLGGRLARHERAERAGLAAMAAVVLAGLASALLTFIFPIPRPAIGVESPLFPWGHASPAFALATVLGHAFPTWAPLLTLAAILAGVARVYQRTHVLAAVAVGALLGTGLGVVSARALLTPAPPKRARVAWGLGLVAVMVAVPLVAFFAAYERALAAHQLTGTESSEASPAMVQVEFGSKRARPQLGRGWSGDETYDGRFPMIWAEGHEARVVLPGLPPIEHRLRLRLQPFSVPRRPPCQCVAVSVNGKAVGTLRLDTGWRWYEMRVPAQALGMDRNELQFRFARADRPRDYGRSPDARALSVAFAALEAVPAETRPR
jgi:hypothetical protein